MEPPAASTTRNMRSTPATTTTNNSNNPSSFTIIRVTARTKLSITTTTPTTRVIITSKEQEEEEEQEEEDTVLRVGMRRNTQRAIKIRAGIRTRGTSSHSHSSRLPLLEVVRGVALEAHCWGLLRPAEEDNGVALLPGVLPRKEGALREGATSVEGENSKDNEDREEVLVEEVDPEVLPEEATNRVDMVGLVVAEVEDLVPPEVEVELEPPEVLVVAVVVVATEVAVEEENNLSGTKETIR